jgi:hypothetical protein
MERYGPAELLGRVGYDIASYLVDPVFKYRPEDWLPFQGFTQSLQANVDTVFQNKQRPLSSTSLKIHYQLPSFHLSL